MAFHSRRGIKPFSFKTAFLLALVIFFAISLQTFIYIERQLQPIVLSIATTKVEQLAADAINDAVSKKIAEGSDFKDLVYFQKDGDGKIKAVLFNYNEQSRIVGEATARVSNALKELEAVPLVIPLGQALNSSIFAMLGPDIPITMVPMGAVQVDLIPELKEAGINMVHVNVYIDIRAKVQVVIPFTTKPTVIGSKIPITQGLFMGDVPDVYYKGGSNPQDNSPLMPPIQFNGTQFNGNQAPKK
ncbi:MAG TPA: sporulation protein YunB [Bacillota bacterium]|nr:sporulation protein YunB [Bacillota bacterium]